MTAKRSFTTWLSWQRQRQDPVGDLARDVRADPGWPRRAWANAVFRHYLEDVGACEAALLAFDRAWAEYERSEADHDAGQVPAERSTA